jgi:hypothetical protein
MMHDPAPSAAGATIMSGYSTTIPHREPLKTTPSVPSMLQNLGGKQMKRDGEQVTNKSNYF